MIDLPLVSVVIPTYNNARYICETLDSCLNQTYSNIEIIVVDDGSTDNTRQLVTETYGDNIRYIYQQNAGAAAARNKGIQSAKGEFIKFLDSDDVILPQHIATCVEVFQQSSDDVGLVYTRYHFVASDGKTRLTDLQDPPLLSGDVLCELIESNGVAILTSATMIRAEIWHKVGLFDESPAILGTEDWDFFIKVATQYNYRSVDDASLLYRWHSGGLSANPINMARGRLHAVKNLRDNPRLSDCYTQAQYRHKLAGRYHVYAMALWQTNQHEQAIDALSQAIGLSARSRRIRQVYRVLMQMRLPFTVGQALNDLLRRLR